MQVQPHGAELYNGLPRKQGASVEFSPPNLRDEVSQLPGWTRTEYLGFLDRQSVWQLLAQARIGLVTMHPSSAHFDAWPVKLFEYMCAGMPTITSNFPLWQEIVEGPGCGLVVDPLNPEAIAQAMQFLLTHPQEAEAMGRRGRQAVETRYNWLFDEAKLLQLYERLSKAS